MICARKRIGAVSGAQRRVHVLDLDLALVLALVLDPAFAPVLALAMTSVLIDVLIDVLMRVGLSDTSLKHIPVGGALEAATCAPTRAA